ncbi:MAG: hypothetical protein ABIU54_08270 [Candidatus Eisenbacteria bacterium]
MAMLSNDSQTAIPSPRRVVLLDFDWQDADLMPELLKRPAVSVRLVAGERTQDPGVRVAELCGLPRSVDLADLTREIFDLALVSERSSRRTQLESLLLALGTPCQTPQEFLHGHGQLPARPDIEAPLTVHAAALEQSLGGSHFDSIVQQSSLDLDTATPFAPRPFVASVRARIVVASLDDFPSLEARAQLETAIKDLVMHTGAGTAELHAGEGEQLQLVAHVGPEDKLLRGLIDLALDLGTPQVVTRVTEPGKGRTWGAWPFRTAQRHGVLAAAAIDSRNGWSPWQNMVEELRTTWDEEDREKASASFPFTPIRATGWLELQEFGSRVELSLERNRHDRLRFELHRLDFSEAPMAIEQLCAWLPGQLRDADCLCRPGDRSVLLLAAGPSEAYLNLRRRILALWDTAWRDAGRTSPAPAVVDQHVALAGPEDAESFRAAAGAWLTPQ